MRVFMENQRSNKRAFLGVMLVLVGIVVIVANLNLFPFGLKPILFSWPTILILVGLFFLLSREAKATGWILILVGGIFMIPRMWHNVPWGWNELFWPALLVGLGAILIARGVNRKREGIDEGPNYIEDMSIFGGGDRVISSQEFKGGRVTAIFGGSKYNLINAELAKGRNVLDIFTVFGGCKLIVPQGWEVKIEVSAIFGGFSDKRHIRRDIPRDPSKELVIKGVAIFGGGDIVSF
jgi:predicted membrane protein